MNKQKTSIYKKADLIVLPENIVGTNCANCKWINLESNYCSHPKIGLVLSDSAERMCCAYWDNDKVVRPWGDSVYKSVILVKAKIFKKEK